MNVGILVVDDGPTPPICFGNGSVVRQETRRVIKRLLTPPAR
jgi:hypothetical protein